MCWTGNLTLTGSSNTGVGNEALLALTDGSENTAHGRAALSLTTSGNNNTALGSSALVLNRTGSNNTAVGAEALLSNAGDNNTAVGEDALRSHQAGNENTAVGEGTIESTTVGIGNTAVGVNALRHSTGDRNTALGRNSGLDQTTGSDTIYIGSRGVAAESNPTRIGAALHSRTFISGIEGVTTAGAASAVLIDSNGQLGTVSSSLRYKTDVRDMGALSEGLQRLRPVAFRCQQARAGGQRLEYGLIAEEVAEVFPDIVVYDEAGRPETVQYRKVNAMLLNEVQHQHQRIGDLEQQLATVLGRLAALEGQTTSGEE